MNPLVLNNHILTNNIMGIKSLCCRLTWGVLMASKDQFMWVPVVFSTEQLFTVTNPQLSKRRVVVVSSHHYVVAGRKQANQRRRAQKRKNPRNM
jgi:hypothetical protein